MLFHEILNHIANRRNAALALQTVAKALKEESMPGYIVSRYEEVKGDYDLMCDVMLRGLRDEKIDEVYLDILRKLHSVAVDIFMEEAVKTRPSYAYAKVSAQKTDIHPDAVRKVMEGYVQDMAMLAFEPETVRKEKEGRLRADHQIYMKGLFDAIFVSGLWGDTLSADYVELLLSPTIDRNDALLVISAVTLSTLNVFDPCKWTMLADIYVRSTDMDMKVRGIVGWTLALPHQQRLALLYPFVEDRLKAMLADKSTRRMVLDVQMQVLLCCNADADNAEIQRDIMPTLLKNSNLQTTRLGIVEKEDDPMRDIMDPAAAERDIEEMERKYSKMMDMQKQGADIYFGGFSKMKRFPFFNDLCNWFAPFDASHPALGTARDKLADSPFLSNLMKNGPFCDSDKYSFALALAQVVDKLPANIREMLGSNATLGSTVSEEERVNFSYVCRSYLQSLYRFFRLYSRNGDFTNPFALSQDGENEGRALFMKSPLLACPAMTDEAVALGVFLRKRKLRVEFGALFSQYTFSDDPRVVRMMALGCMDDGRHEEAYRLYASIAESDRTVETLRGMAHCCMVLKRFGEAAALYRRLTDADAASMSCQLNLAVCLMNCGEVDEGMRLLYKLDYEHHGNGNVQRALAWCLMLQENPGKALDIYSALLGTSGAVAVDRLNAAYAHWLSKDVRMAVKLLREYCTMCGCKSWYGRLVEDFKNDSALLDKYGIRLSERKIMVDIVANGN